MLIVFALSLLIGGGFIVASMVFEGIGDTAGDLLGGLDSLLEGIGVDLIPDTFLETKSSRGLGCSSMASFLAGFGAVGTGMTLMGANPWFALVFSLVGGVSVGFVYFLAMGYLLRQQSTTTLTESDFIGQSGHSTISVPAGAIGQVQLTVNGEVKSYPFREISDQPLVQGDLVGVVELKGSLLICKKL